MSEQEKTVDKDITVEEFDALVAEAFALKEKKAVLEKQASDVEKQLGAVNTKLLNYLQHFKKDNYRAGAGMVYIAKQFSVTQPKDAEKKRQFLEYLKAKGEDFFEGIISVNSKTLQSFVKQEMDAARESGDIDFKIPGLDEPTYFERVVLKK